MSLKQREFYDYVWKLALPNGKKGKTEKKIPIAQNVEVDDDGKSKRTATPKLVWLILASRHAHDAWDKVGVSAEKLVKGCGWLDLLHVLHLGNGEEGLGMLELADCVSSLAIFLLASRMLNKGIVACKEKNRKISYGTGIPKPTLDPGGSGMGLKFYTLGGMDTILGPSLTIRVRVWVWGYLEGLDSFTALGGVVCNEE
ncbi:hypothetical protein M9H77_13739 [Catharanthus roseus]|uniref:Uncharacterized protein n=1 Tax=Catharanthus roseus TaxID=4058 RepID=A0ACC0BL47_CATRO|nr:hypothetical protein M9H77_13739 [Catharanthus roseus]